MSHDKATKTLDRLSGMSEAAINELDNMIFFAHEIGIQTNW